ncbi:hypothetical protein F4678DRAFT_196096 [Xylaria arbuscula]|nr:hypothetical protein F4678DRAFT_196096 [Xylaria arbuscula]
MTIPPSYSYDISDDRFTVPYSQGSSQHLSNFAHLVCDGYLPCRTESRYTKHPVAFFRLSRSEIVFPRHFRGPRGFDVTIPHLETVFSFCLSGYEEFPRLEELSLNGYGFRGGEDEWEHWRNQLQWSKLM